MLLHQGPLWLNHSQLMLPVTRPGAPWPPRPRLSDLQGQVWPCPAGPQESVTLVRPLPSASLMSLGASDQVGLGAVLGLEPERCPEPGVITPEGQAGRMLCSPGALPFPRGLPCARVSEAVWGELPLGSAPHLPPPRCKLYLHFPDGNVRPRGHIWSRAWRRRLHLGSQSRQRGTFPQRSGGTPGGRGSGDAWIPGAALSFCLLQQGCGLGAGQPRRCICRATAALWAVVAVGGGLSLRACPPPPLVIFPGGAAGAA